MLTNETKNDFQTVIKYMRKNLSKNEINEIADRLLHEESIIRKNIEKQKHKVYNLFC